MWAKSFIKRLLQITILVLLWGSARAQDVLPTEDSIIVTVRPLPASINSSFSEYVGKLLHDSTFLFTAMRNDAAEDAEHFFETNWYCYLYESKALPDERYAPARPLPLNLNHPKYFNSNFCLSEDGQRMLLTRCVRSGDGDLQCSLWQSTKEKGTWGKPKILPSVINAKGYSSLQPCIVQLPGYEVLYYVSDRPGGYGKLDVWYSICQNGHFQEPVNLGPIINTEGNDITPFYDERTKMLYFSTDERKGYGDYDIFCSEGALGAWKNPKHLREPFNSSYNDFYFALNQNDNSAFFSSNRPYGDIVDEDTCCNDIFYVKWELPVKEEVVDTLPQTDIHEKIASVLPITLYFQNDFPDPKSLSDTTDKDYMELYNSYIGDIQEYIHKSGQGLTGEEQRRAMYAVAGFMRDSVQTGYVRLQLLTDYLQEAIENGDTVELSISGFASPLHNSEYNKHLSSRRIVSLLNYLRKVDNGKLIPYINGEKAGISLHISPEGAVNHLFETEEVRETVFGLRAAKDRKIVITGR